ncbi:SDR family NAD(P)-dependent oxidoreductase [Streptomyces sp. NPDC050549]|uniref:SDR family NAD(P)-dependent oxidoreductase n=1 Tax=Streptomyces sp. NPDC050549 TaxID=3155406 RepID=UPI00343F9D79
MKPISFQKSKPIGFLAQAQGAIRTPPHRRVQVAVVTGASRGIGPAVVRALVAEGGTVHAGARHSSAGLEELAATGSVRVVPVGLGEASGPARLVEAAGDRIDILVNNVGSAPARTGRTASAAVPAVPLFIVWSNSGVVRPPRPLTCVTECSPACEVAYAKG